MNFMSVINGIKTVAGKSGEVIKNISSQKTKRMGNVRGWAAPIIFILTALPFPWLLWLWFGSAAFRSLNYASQNAIQIVNTIGPMYFFSIVSILLTGSGAAVGILAKKKMEVDVIKHKEEQETIRKVATNHTGLTPFEEAFQITLGHEGGYGNDPDDTGGETYKGIARKHHPKWAGWKVIDRAKRKMRTFPESLDTNKALPEAVKEFYKEKFWTPLKCQELSKISRKIAIELFDTGVNCGHKNATKFLQRALSRNGFGFFGGITDDGKIGDVTINALEVLLPKYESQVFKSQTGEQYKHYVDITNRKPSQKKFFRGWMKRI